MNCCAGDLALVVKGNDRVLGQMVTCVRLMAPGELITIGGFNHGLPAGPACWLVEPPVQWLLRFTDDLENTTEHYVPAPYCADQCLMPIRPERDEDLETDVVHEELA